LFKINLWYFIKCIQSFKIIPEFIQWYKQNIKDIKFIITYYYIQNLFFILLSSWILYNIIIKLNLFIDNIHLFILGFGFIFSFIFILYYPLKDFTFYYNEQGYSLKLYFLFVLFCLLWW